MKATNNGPFENDEKLLDEFHINNSYTAKSLPIGRLLTMYSWKSSYFNIHKHYNLFDDIHLF